MRLHEAHSGHSISMLLIFFMYMLSISNVVNLFVINVRPTMQLRWKIQHSDSSGAPEEQNAYIKIDFMTSE